MYLSICLSIHIFLYSFLYSYVFKFIIHMFCLSFYSCVFIYLFIHMFLFIYSYVFIHLFTHMFLFIYSCVFVYSFILIFTCLFTHTFIQSSSLSLFLHFFYLTVYLLLWFISRGLIISRNLLLCYCTLSFRCVLFSYPICRVWTDLWPGKYSEIQLFVAWEIQWNTSTCNLRNTVKYSSL